MTLEAESTRTAQDQQLEAPLQQDAVEETPQAHVVETERLLLRPFTRDEISAVTDGREHPGFAPGFPPPETVDQLSEVEASGAFYFTETLYAPLAVVEKGTARVIGSTGFATPPIDGMLEVVAFLAEPSRGKGYASEGIDQLVRLAFSSKEVCAVRASVPEPDDPAELVLVSHGFEKVEDHMGAEIEYQLTREAFTRQGRRSASLEDGPDPMSADRGA